MNWDQWRPYVPVARRRVNALREMSKLRKKGRNVQPVEIRGRTIAHSFWGKGWCDHLEGFSDYENRLPRGRSYVRNGSVCHLEIKPGRIEAIVSGSELYNIRINIERLQSATWRAVQDKCAGRIGSMLELLQGMLSDEVMTVVTDRDQGLFPRPHEIEFNCDCPDWAVMCKHVAAVLYGVGSRLDTQPELLFRLRHVDAEELISTELKVPASVAAGHTLDERRLQDIFDIDLEVAGQPRPTPRAQTKRRRSAKDATSTTTGNKSRPSTRRKPARSTLQPKNKRKKTKKSTTKKKKATTGRKKPTSTTANGRAPSQRTEHTRRTAPSIRPTGKSVARLRATLKLPATEFADRLGVSTASVHRWEATSGRLRLQARTLAALVELLLKHREK